MKDATKGAGAGPGALFVVALLAGAAGGAVVALSAWAQRDADQPATKGENPEARSSQDAADLARAIDGLRNDIQRLRLDVADGEPARTSDGSSPIVTTEPLELALASLTAAVERVTRATRAADWPPSLEPDPARSGVLKDFVLEPDRWRLWTVQQLLETYGPPNLMTSFNGGLHWGYLMDDGSIISFTIAEGLAIDVHVQKR